MSKETDRVPIPEDNIERFMMLVWSMAGPCGVDQVPEVLHYVELLGQAVDRYSFEKKHKVSPQKKVSNDRAKFITIFKQRYMLAYDLEYGHRLTGVEGKLINQANRTLRDAGFECDEYLKWVFDSFLVDNPKFAPANMKQMCSNFVLHRFIVEHREVREERSKADKEKKDALSLIAKGRTLMRDAKAGGDKEFEQRVKDILKKFKDKSIMLPELRKSILGFEVEWKEKGD
jgi:hypothetical protein